MELEFGCEEQLCNSNTGPVGAGLEASPNLNLAVGDRLLEHRDGVHVLGQFGGELRDGMCEFTQGVGRELRAAACCCIGCGGEADDGCGGEDREAGVAVSPTQCWRGHAGTDGANVEAIHRQTHTWNKTIESLEGKNLITLEGKPGMGQESPGWIIPGEPEEHEAGSRRGVRVRGASSEEREAGSDVSPRKGGEGCHCTRR